MVCVRRDRRLWLAAPLLTPKGESNGGLLSTTPCTAVVIVTSCVAGSSSRRVILARRTSSAETFEEDDRGLFCGERRCWQLRTLPGICRGLARSLARIRDEIPMGLGERSSGRRTSLHFRFFVCGGGQRAANGHHFVPVIDTSASGSANRRIVENAPAEL